MQGLRRFVLDRQLGRAYHRRIPDRISATTTLVAAADEVDINVTTGE